MFGNMTQMGATGYVYFIMATDPRMPGVGSGYAAAY
jgi:hypothetical protein